MKTKYYSYLANFLNEAKRERILFELQSKKKRENAFSKITVFSECFNDNHIFCDLSHVENEVAFSKIKQIVGNSSCYDLRYEEINQLKDAYIRAINSYMADVLIVDENTIIYIGECELGASPKYILKTR